MAAPSLDDFESLRVLGKGSYGKVYLVRRKNSPSMEIYAMKMLRKEHVMNRALARRLRMLCAFVLRSC